MGWLLAGCGGGAASLKDSWATKLSPAPEGVELTPGPPAELYFLRFASVKLPPKSRHGQAWDEDGLPDPYAVLYVNGREVMRTETASNTNEALFRHPGVNVELAPDAELRVEVFENDPIDDVLVGAAEIRPPSSDDLRRGFIDLEVIRRGEVRLEVAPARAMIGLGFDYKVVDSEVYVLQVIRHSPAGRSGMKAGDRVVAIDGAKVKRMSHNAIKSAFNAVAPEGIEIVVMHEGGTTQTMRLEDGPVYALFDELRR